MPRRRLTRLAESCRLVPTSHPVGHVHEVNQRGERRPGRCNTDMHQRAPIVRSVQRLRRLCVAGTGSETVSHVVRDLDFAESAHRQDHMACSGVVHTCRSLGRSANTSGLSRMIDVRRVFQTVRVFLIHVMKVSMTLLALGGDFCGLLRTQRRDQGTYPDARVGSRPVPVFCTLSGGRTTYDRCQTCFFWATKADPGAGEYRPRRNIFCAG